VAAKGLDGHIKGVEFGVSREVRIGDLVVIERGVHAWGGTEVKQGSHLFQRINRVNEFEPALLPI
jgi:hypothetical protein